MTFANLNPVLLFVENDCFGPCCGSLIIGAIIVGILEFVRYSNEKTLEAREAAAKAKEQAQLEANKKAVVEQLAAKEIEKAREAREQWNLWEKKRENFYKSSEHTFIEQFVKIFWQDLFIFCIKAFFKFL